MRFGADLAYLIIGPHNYAAGHVLDNLGRLDADLRYLAQLVAVHVEKANGVCTAHADLVAHQIQVNSQDRVN